MYTRGQQGYRILNGPNKDRLIDAFKYAYDKPFGCLLPLEFDVEFDVDTTKTQACQFHVISIEHEDGSGHSFNIKGSCLIPKLAATDLHRTFYTGYYNASTRKGWVKFFHRL